jgi:predicted dehydrogenase
MTDQLGIGIIGCGNISTTYFTLAPLFRGLEVRACADVNMDVARAQADAYGAKAQSVEDLLRNDDVQVVINLTIQFGI